MPTAESFTALGVGNGFSFCPTKVDVSSYALWTTISGFNQSTGGTPTAAQIEESRRLAMLWFWNSYEVKFTIQFSVDPIIIDVAPKDRICNPSSAYYAEGGLGFFTASADLIHAMYNGSTSDEANFVGFGLGGAADINSAATWIWDDDSYDQYIELHCAHNSYSSNFEATAYTTLPVNGTSDSLHCVCYATQIDDKPGLIDPANRAITQSGFEMSIDSLDVYTY